MCVRKQRGFAHSTHFAVHAIVAAAAFVAVDGHRSAPVANRIAGRTPADAVAHMKPDVGHQLTR